MTTRKKLRKTAEKWHYRVEIAELQHRLRELATSSHPMGFRRRGNTDSPREYSSGLFFDEPDKEEEGVTIMGGKPKPGGTPDKRLKENKSKSVSVPAKPKKASK